MRARLGRALFRTERAIWRFGQSEAGRATGIAAILGALACGSAGIWGGLAFAVTRKPGAATVGGFGLILAVAFAAVAVLVDHAEGGR